MQAKTIPSTDDGIRKAAILLSSLDRVSADAMLDALAPEQSQRVRQAAMELGPIDPKEQRRVIDEFRGVGPKVPPPQKQPPGIELGGRLAERLSRRQQPCTAGTTPREIGVSRRPFEFLEEAETERLARILEEERPQTIALVLSHLPQKRAGSMLARLPGPLQADVIRRLVDLEETDLEILAEVEQALQSRLSEPAPPQRRRVAGLEAVHGILEASEGPLGMQILDNLGAHDRFLAERLAPPPVRFDDLARWDDATLAVVFRAATAELMITALIGAAPELIDRILSRLPPSQADTLCRKLHHPGPIRLKDVETARQRIADVARRLAIEGRIQIPHELPATVS